MVKTTNQIASSILWAFAIVKLNGHRQWGSGWRSLFLVGPAAVHRLRHPHTRTAVIDHCLASSSRFAILYSIISPSLYYHICVGVSKFHHKDCRKKKPSFSKIGHGLCLVHVPSILFQSSFSHQFPIFNFPQQSGEVHPNFSWRKRPARQRQVQTYGPDVDLALVKIHESVEDEFWAPWKNRDRGRSELIGRILPL
jgi:hypothetical protein